jgi:hypothetical protein
MTPGEFLKWAFTVFLVALMVMSVIKLWKGGE